MISQAKVFLSIAAVTLSISVLLSACTAAVPGTTIADAPVCVVTAQNLNLRSGPGVDFPRIAKMPEGSRFAVRAQNGTRTWYVGSWDGETGWASGTFMDCPAEVSMVPRLTVWPEAPTPDAPLAAPNRPRPSQAQQPVRAASAPAPVVNNAGSVTLLEPLAPALSGRLIFKWTPSVTLGANQGYEMVFWQPGQDPMVNGFSPIGARPESEVRVNLEETASSLTMLNFGQDYQWGVLLVQLEPYQRLAYLGGAHPFRFLSAGGGGDDDGGDAPRPESTNEPIDPGQPAPTRAPSSPFEPTPEPDRPNKPPAPPGSP